jgi:hypothetical protein
MIPKGILYWATLTPPKIADARVSVSPLELGHWVRLGPGRRVAGYARVRLGRL